MKPYKNPNSEQTTNIHKKIRLFQKNTWFFETLCYNIWALRNALLAQLDRVFGYEPKGQGFESLAARQKRSDTSVLLLFLFFINFWGIRTLRGWATLRKQSCGLFLVAKCEAGTVACDGRRARKAACRLYPLQRAKTEAMRFCVASVFFIQGFEPWEGERR